MKNKGGYNAYEIDIDYRHEQYMKKKAALRKLKSGKTGLVMNKGGKENESKSN